MPIIAVATKTTYATIVTHTKYPTKANFYQFSNFLPLKLSRSFQKSCVKSS